MAQQIEITLKIDQKGTEALDRIRKKMNLPTREAVLARALTLLTVVSREMEECGVLIIRNPGVEEIEIV